MYENCINVVFMTYS